MTVFRDNKIGVNRLLEVNPDVLFSGLSLSIKIDHSAKVFHGKKTFNLLLYGI